MESDRARKSAAGPDWEGSPKAASAVQPSGLGRSAGAAGLNESSGLDGSARLQPGEASAPDLQGYSPGTAVASAPGEVSPEELQAQVIEALERANSRTPIVEVASEGTELVIKVGMAQTLVDAGLALSEDARQGAVAAAVRALGRPVKLRVVGGPGNQPTQSNARAPFDKLRAGSAPQDRPANGPGARTRAADDPVVRRVQEKFSAQIRTVIDHREKR